MSTVQEKKCISKLALLLRQENRERGARNKANGEAFEFRVLRKFKRRSDVAFVIRSAGSHSIIDIIVQYKNKKQLWISCKKNGYTEPSERKQIEQVVAMKPDNVEVREYFYKSVKKMCYRTIA